MEVLSYRRLNAFLTVSHVSLRNYTTVTTVMLQQ